MADFCSSPNPGVITHTEQPHTQHEAPLKDLPAHSAPAGNYLNQWNHSTGCRKSKGVKQVRVDGKKSGCTWLQMISSFAYSRRSKQKENMKKSAVNFRKASNGWAEFLCINRIPFPFKQLLQNFCHTE